MELMTNISAKICFKNIKPEEIFWLYHIKLDNKVPDINRQKILNKFINFKIRQDKQFRVLTYNIKPPKRGTDDEIYFENKELVNLLPRGMTIVLDDNDNYVTSLTGTKKFSGANLLDEDDVEDNNFSLYDPVKTISWVLSHSCEITKLTKANGKFSILKIFSYLKKDYIIFGSKNMHYICPINKIEEYLKDNQVSDIVNSIGIDISKNISNLLKLKECFDDGYSLVGELEDGMHFVPGDNTISWFGLFKNGSPDEPLKTLNMLTAIGLKTVKKEIIFNPGDKRQDLEFALVKSRLDSGEGSVLYIRNISSDETQLVKSKSAIYKIKRMFRQKWLNSPIDIRKGLINRLIETNDYHSLKTESTIYFASKLFDFALWLANNNFPVAVLDFLPVESVRGYLPVGFSIYWEKFLKETKTEDIELAHSDFGEFDRKKFENSEDLNLMPELNLTGKNYRPLVIFIQDIQGGGKSTIVNVLNNVEMIEQDICYGCTKITQFKLLNFIRNGKNVVVSRCNTNPLHYKAYLKIALDNHCRVLFISSENMNSELRLAIALAGILHRSQTGDSVLVGRKEYPFLDVIKFTTDTWKSFKYHEKVIKIKTFEKDDDLLDEFKKVINKPEKVKNFIELNKDKLMNLRVPIKQISSNIQKIIDNPPDDFVKKNISDVQFVSLNILEREKLIKILKENSETKNGEIYCHHLTQIFFTKNKKIKKIDIPDEFEPCKIYIDSLVINLENKSSAFHVTKILDSKDNYIEVESGIPHITALVINSKPADSKKFVNKIDESVKVIPLNLLVSAICIWN